MNPNFRPGTANATGSVGKTPPVGYRFCPNDDQLIGYLLMMILLDYDDQDMPIGIVNFYELEPWELPGLSKIKSKDQVWYFFCMRTIYGNKKKRAYKRKTKAGYWKPTGEIRKIGKGKNGTKKTLVFCKNGSKAVKTEWVIHEYEVTQSSNVPNSGELVVIKLIRKVDEKTKKSKPNQHTSASDFENQNQNEVTTCDGREIIPSDFENQNQNEVTSCDGCEIIPSDFENQNLVGVTYDISKPSTPMTPGCGEQSATVLEGDWSPPTTSDSDLQSQNDITTTPACGGREIIPKYQGMAYDIGEPSYAMTSDCEVQSTTVLESRWSPLMTSASDFENQNEMKANSACVGPEFIPLDFECQNLSGTMAMSTNDIGEQSYHMAVGCEIQSSAVEFEEGEWCFETTFPYDLQNASSHENSQLKYPMLSDFAKQRQIGGIEEGEQSPSMATPSCESQVALEKASLSCSMTSNLDDHNQNEETGMLELEVDDWWSCQMNFEEEDNVAGVIFPEVDPPNLADLNFDGQLMQ